MVAARLNVIEQPEWVLHAIPRPRLSLVIPAFNEEQRIGPSLQAVAAYLAEQSYPFEVIVADDGSTDSTSAIAARFAGENEGFRLLPLAHGGKAAAIRSGMRAAAGEVVAFVDADLATPPSYLTAFLERIDDGADIVIGSREGTGARRVGEPAYRHVMGRVFNRIVQLVLLPGIDDTQCGFKLFTRPAAEAILDRGRLYAGGQTVAGARVTAFDVEMLVIARRLGLRIDEVPVLWTYGSHSKVNPVRDTLYNLRDIATVAWNAARRRYS